jgi:hypothetical protein
LQSRGELTSEIALVYVFDPVTTSVNMEQIRNNRRTAGNDEEIPG